MFIRTSRLSHYRLHVDFDVLLDAKPLFSSIVQNSDQTCFLCFQAVSEQRLIYAGKLLPDHLHIKDLFRQVREDEKM